MSLLSRLLLCASCALLPVLPAHAAVHKEPYEINSTKTPQAIAGCLDQGIAKLKIPKEYVRHDTADNGALSVMLHNPVSGKTGLAITLRPKDEGATVEVDPNGIPVAKPWERMIERCAR